MSGRTDFHPEIIVETKVEQTGFLTFREGLPETHSRSMRLAHKARDKLAEVLGWQEAAYWATLSPVKGEIY